MITRGETVTSGGDRKLVAARDGSSAYLTDGIRLFRVVTRLSWPPTETRAELEDCMTLAVDRYTADELWEMGLRLVGVRDGGPAEGLRGTRIHDQEEER